jgi:hypothetical protein
MDVVRRFELLGTLAIVAAIYGFAVMAAMHFLAPEIDPIRAPGSAYVLGPYGALVTTTYFTGSVGNLALGYGLKEAIPQVRLARIAWLLFVGAAVGGVVAGLFPMDFPPPVRTTSGRLHALGGGISFPLGTIGIFLFSLGFRRDGNWRPVSRVALGLSAAILGALCLGILSVVSFGFAGYMQRVLMMLQIAWVIVVGLHLRRFAQIAGSSLVDKTA